ncbi:HpcH/HpaI aldolase/citrate lyase family protein [Rhodococcus opacus]
MNHTGFAGGPALLFCPGDRPDRYEKALERADIVILDLEDAVSPDRKQAAREALRAHPLDPHRVIVRVNATGSTDFDLDVQAVKNTHYSSVMLPKAERRADVEALSDWQVVALCETARGVLAASDIALATNIAGLMWGAEDLVASIGGSASRHADGHYRAVAAHARSSVLLAAASAGVAAVDSVYLNIADTAGLGEEAEDAVASGFAAKACIHPGQVSVVRDAFRPTDEEVDWARRVLAGGEASGVFALDGQMIDAPVLRQAEALLRRIGYEGRIRHPQNGDVAWRP